MHAPESVALTSPVSASGVFDLDAQPDLLLPFEGTGVDTRWTFDLPQPANPFDYRSLADVLITIEYTATSDPDYRDAMLRQLADAGRITGDRVLSLRTDFVDQIYELNNPADPTVPRQVTLTLGKQIGPTTGIASPAAVRATSTGWPRTAAGVPLTWRRADLPRRASAIRPSRTLRPPRSARRRDSDLGRRIRRTR